MQSVKNAAHRLYVKIGADNRTQAVVFAVNMGLIKLAEQEE